MSIVVNLDVMLARRKMRLGELADRVGITIQNLSVLKTGKARAIRFSTLDKLCDVLDCQPGDLLAFETDEAASHRETGEPPSDHRLSRHPTGLRPDSSMHPKGDTPT
jgi:putative transcriptional regulator